ncbi:hypothetical protein [Paenibacillus albus]|uniref:Uncharacterized protein n=1 Tax=Paenibacillus albus TaxID=2495582 RepID=A0A3S8ZYK1_9BACL|nr:hypothetical protein [Paenibacillus albus]AZN38542.1 hypothetical protein EJC50_01790 [Paenibacillus albus]
MKLRIGIFIAAIIIGIGVVVQLSNDRNISAEGDVVPGSVNDPVVTKSYIDQKVSDLVKAELAKQQGGQDNTQLQKTLDEFRAELQQNKGGQKVEVVTVPVGKRLVAKDGAEFVVRAGKAMAYSADSNGISDLTDGKDITNSKPVPNNHLILFPRGGRGVTAQVGQTSALTVLVRGDYELQAQQ